MQEVGQLSLLQVEGNLRNGEKINIGDVVMCEYGPYKSITRIIEEDGYLCLEKHFMHGDGVKLSHMNNVDYCYITKMSPKDVYLYCKKNKWKTEEYLKLFLNAKNNCCKQ